jgi:magnesium transporter
MKTTCYELGPDGREIDLDPNGTIESWHAGEGPFWVDIEDADPAATTSLLSSHGLDQESIDQILEPGHAPRILPLDDGLFFEFPMLIAGDPPDLNWVDFVCLDRVLITIRQGPTTAPHWLDAAALRRFTLEARSTSELVCALLVEGSIALRRSVSEARGTMGKLSARLDIDPESVSLDEILDLKRRLFDFDAVSEERMTILESLALIRQPVFDLTPYSSEFKVAQGNTAATSRRVDRLVARAGDLQSRHDAVQQEKTNQRLSRLTIISAIFLPLTLLAGIYGMNFDKMPELHHPLGYPLTLAGMGLIATGLYLWFRSKGWMSK